jgi:hypothetical protein
LLKPSGILASSHPNRAVGCWTKRRSIGNCHLINLRVLRVKPFNESYRAPRLRSENLFHAKGAKIFKRSSLVGSAWQHNGVSHYVLKPAESQPSSQSNSCSAIERKGDISDTSYANSMLFQTGRSRIVVIGQKLTLRKSVAGKPASRRSQIKSYISRLIRPAVPPRSRSRAGRPIRRPFSCTRRDRPAR